MRNLKEGILSTSLLKAAKGSDAAQSIVKDWKRCQIATTVQHKFVVDGVLGLAPCHYSGKLQVRRDDQSRYHNLKPPSSLGSGWNEIHCPPAVDSNWKNDMKSKTKNSKS